MLELNEDNQLVMDLNEEEENNNQNTSELTETDFIDNSGQRNLTILGQRNSLSFYPNRIELIQSNNLEVSLPPPKILG